ncbi:hypothetical protein VTN49DRAFT_3882 [Thermomyces lanuginosus]|uniref:uncharacterized protein n=1 Tax=Thermomyces lanuginosus TaxID=5541 RepID=UPI003742CCEF
MPRNLATRIPARALSWASTYRLARPSSRCASCLNSLRWLKLQHRVYATSADTKKPFYVTTPIFYVNAAPHVGHFYTMVLADTFKRWQLLLGNTDAQFLTGTDEHGIKIQRAAQKAGMDTQSFCDMNCKTFQDLAKMANIKNDHFIRTTDETHKEAVRYFWEMLQHRGYIYTSKHEGWYSVSDETFFPQSQVQSALDPATGRKRMVSIETGKEVEWSSETNYHFRLSALRDQLLQFYHDNPDFVRPKPFMDAVVKSVESGLSDLSISRPIERLSWGIRVPGDDSQTVYVWLDALVNYLTKAGYPFPPGEESKLGWPADIHVIGKDIVRFHAIYWPAFLLALDLPLPRNILVHGHWTMNREKMSKSTGNVVNPFFAVDRFGIDTMRFFLTYQGPLGDDSDYDNSFIVRDYKKLLMSGIGNFINRVPRIVNRDVEPCMRAAAEDKLPEPSAEDVEFEEFLKSVPSRVADQMNNLNPKGAIREVMGIIDRGQKYFHATAPWEYKKTDVTQAYRIIYNAMETFRITALLLQPFMPDKAAEILDMIRVDPAKRGFRDAMYGGDQTYARGGVDWKILFPKLIVED